MDSLMKRIQEDMRRYQDRRGNVRSNLIEILTVRHLSPDSMHPNPEDEFCDPAVGPNEKIIEKYIREARRDIECGSESFDEPIMVEKMDPEGYMIVNGHHRWAAAMKVGLDRVRVLVVNPGWENIESALLR